MLLDKFSHRNRMAKVLSRPDLNVLDMSSNKKPVIKTQRMDLGKLLFIVSDNGRMLRYYQFSQQIGKGYWHLHNKGFTMLQSLIKNIGSKVYLRLGSHSI